MDDRGRMVSALDQARAGGARGAEVLRVRRQILEQAGATVRAVLREEHVWSVRAWLEGGRGGVGIADTPGAAVASALTGAAAALPDSRAGPIERMSVRAAGLGIHDHRHESIEDGDRAEILAHAERAFSRGGIRVKTLRYRQVREERVWMSSRGVEAAEATTRYELSAAIACGAAEARHRIASRHFSDVASLPFGPELLRRVEALARPASLPASPVPLVLEPRVFADLVRLIASAFAAHSVASGNSLNGTLGVRIAPSILHITDDAGVFGGLHTRGFDDRGVPPIAVTLLKEGVAHGHYHDPETARAAGLRPTGHVSGAALAPSNLIVRPGARTRNVLLTEVGCHLLLDRVPAFDLRTGAFAGPVPVVVVDRGERVGAALVRMETTMPALLARIRELASDQERSCEVDAPTAVFEGPVFEREGF